MSLSILLRDLDINTLDVINSNRTIFFDYLFRIVSDLTSWVTYLVPTIILILAIYKNNKNLTKQSLIFFGAAIFNSFASSILKNLIDRPRPFITYDFIEKLGQGGSPSFPSGHTADGFVFATIILLLFPNFRFYIPAFIWAILVGYSRMYLGVHYPSDVLSGALLGAVSALIIYNIFKRRIN